MLSNYIDTTNILYQSLNYGIKKKLKEIREVKTDVYDTKLLGDKLEGNVIYYVDDCDDHEILHTYCQHILKNVDFDKQMLNAYLKEVHKLLEINKYDLRYASLLDAYAEVISLCLTDYDKYTYQFSNMLNQLIRIGVLDLDKFTTVDMPPHNYVPDEDVSYLFKLAKSDGLLIYIEELYVCLYCMSKYKDDDMYTFLNDIKKIKSKGLLKLIHKRYEDDEYIDKLIQKLNS